jgi:hypothetical protein
MELLEPHPVGRSAAAKWDGCPRASRVSSFPESFLLCADPASAPAWLHPHFALPQGVASMKKLTTDNLTPPTNAIEAGPLEQLPPATVERLAKEQGWLVPAIVARAFTSAGVGLRVKILSRMLRAVGPLALAVVGGGVFARYVQQARWSALSVSITDAARVTSAQIYELATYVQQSNPEVTRQILNALSRDVPTMTSLGATIGAIALSYLSGRTTRLGS